MAWLRRRDSAANELHKVAGRVEVERNRCVHEAATCNRDSTANTEGRKSQAYPVAPKKTADKDLTYITATEVHKRDGKEGNRLFIVVDGIVLDCTDYVYQHPGGKQLIQGFAGKNCDWQWWSFHNRNIWNDVAVNLRVGRTDGLANRFVKPPAYIGLRPFGYQDD